MARGKSASTIDLQAQVVEITDNLRKYWPLTLRQIYYQLVAAGKQKSPAPTGEREQGKGQADGPNCTLNTTRLQLYFPVFACILQAACPLLPGVLDLFKEVVA